MGRAAGIGRWGAAAIACYLAIAALHGLAVQQLGPAWVQLSAARWAYAGSFLVFGVVLLGFVARAWPLAGAPAWRVLMIVLGAIAAAAELWALARWFGTTPQLETWMAALLGIVAAALLPRFLPSAWVLRWMPIVANQRPGDGG